MADDKVKTAQPFTEDDKTNHVPTDEAAKPRPDQAEDSKKGAEAVKTTQRQE